MYATKPEENGFYFFLFFFNFTFSLIVFSFQEYKFFMELGALHYIAAVVTLHAEYLYMELLPKMYGKIKILNSLLKSNALEHFKVLLEYGSKKKKKKKTFLDVGCKWDCMGPWC